MERMTPLDYFSGFIPLAVLGLLTFGVVRLLRRGNGSQQIDPAVLVRRVVTFGLLYLTMVLTAVGVVMVFDAVTGPASRQTTRHLAEALSLVVISAPLFTGLLVATHRRLGREEAERTSVSWSLYFTMASMTALVGMMVGAYNLVSDTIVDRPGHDVDARYVAMMLIWGAFFFLHWLFLRPRHGLRGDLHLAAGSLVGLAPLAIGQAGLLAVLADRIYAQALDRPIQDLGNESAPWLALFLVGCAAWIGIWLRRYEPAPRTEAWYVVVLPFGALAGFVAVLGATARLLYLALVWVIGETNGSSAGDHFDDVGVLVGIGATGLIAWLYHRSFVSGTSRKNVVRTNAVRSYDYLLMAASLVAEIVGAVMIVSSLISTDPLDRNLAIGGTTLLLIGGVTWSRVANHVVAHQTGDDGIDEIRSPVRRSYLYLTLGAGGFAALIAGLSALEGILDDRLNDALGMDSIVDHREQLATVLIIAGVMWFHALILRHDQKRSAAVPPPPPAALWPRRIIILGADAQPELDLSGHPGTSVEYWHRADDGRPPVPERPIDVADLETVIASQSTDDVLVLVDGGAPTVIPFER